MTESTAQKKPQRPFWKLLSMLAIIAITLTKGDTLTVLMFHISKTIRECIFALIISSFLSTANCEMWFNLAYGGKSMNNRKKYSLDFLPYLQINSHGSEFQERQW